MNDLTTQFIDLLPKLQAVDICGLARIYGVKLRDEETKEPRSGEKIVSEIIIAFGKSNRSAKRQVMKMVKDVVKYNIKEGKLPQIEKEEVTQDGSTTEN